MRIIITCLLVMAGINGFAQDANYWQSPYGNGGFFLPGAVIAYNGDSGVYFTNPALLAQSAKSVISVEAVLYQLQNIRLKNGAGTNKDLDSKTISSVPQMVSGRFQAGKKKFPFAWAIIHNPEINFDADQRRDDKFQVLNDAYSPGTEYFLGQYVEQNHVSETQLQLSAGSKLARNLFGGLTLEANAYSRYYSTDFSAHALVNPGIVDFSMVSSEVYYIASYKNYGVRIKAGLSYNIHQHHFGLTVSSPVAHLAGSGSITCNIAASNLKVDPSSPPIDVLADTRQTGLKVKWKVPFSIAGGYLYQYDKGQLYVAAEYFGKVNEYDILSPRNESFIRPDTGNLNTLTYTLLRLKDVRKAVLNVAVGSSFFISKTVMSFVSLRTNFSYFDKGLFKDDNGFYPYTSAWNNYHVQIGVSKKRKQMNLKVGMFFAVGFNGKYDQITNFDDPNESNALQGDIKTVDAKLFTTGVMISYIHNL